MKRSPGSPTFGGGPPKRFDAMRSSPQMQLQQHLHHQQMHHLHQQQQQQHQQYQHNAAVAAALAANAPFFTNVNTPPPGMQNLNGMNGMNSMSGMNSMNAMNSMNGMNSLNVMNGMSGMNTMNGMMSFPSPNSAANPYLYNANVGMQARMWKYNLPPSPATPPLGYDINTQPPLPLLPPQQPPPLPPPPLPPSEEEPQKFPATNTYIPSSMSMNTGSNGTVMEYEDVQLINKKTKRKTMSNRSSCSKPWDREDALKAIALEKEYAKKTKSKILLLRFPDPELSRDIVSKYSPQIESVHFQQNSAPRFCFVHLKEDADIDKVMENLSQVPFGNGFIKVELKRSHVIDTPQPIIPEEIDPYTLYIGNLPTTISSRTVKEHFPGAQRIDIGHALRMKYTRYAFVRYHTVEESIDAFRKSVNTLIESRSPIVRFRRFPCNEQKIQRNKETASAVPTAAAASSVETAAVVQPVQEANKELDTDKETTVSDKATVSKHCSATPAQASKLDESLTGSTAFDSPSSLEDSVQVLPMLDSKDKVFIEAEHLKRKMPAAEVTALNAPQRRSSIEEMFEELEHRRRELENIASSAKSTTEVNIKKESEDFDEPSEDEEPLSLLGTRYKESGYQIKPDPDASPIAEDRNMNADDIYHDDFEFDEEYDSEPEETNAIAWTGPPTMQALKITDTSNSATANNSNWEIIPKKEHEDVEIKPSVENLTLSSRNKSNSGLPFPFPAHTSEIEKLYEQQRQFKKREESKRPRDDLDDMFARMNSDTEEDEDDFF